MAKSRGPRTSYRSNETPEERKAKLESRRARQRTLPKTIHEAPSTRKSRTSAKYEPNGERECARRVRQAKRKVAQ